MVRVPFDTEEPNEVRVQVLREVRPWNLDKVFVLAKGSQVRVGSYFLDRRNWKLEDTAPTLQFARNYSDCLGDQDAFQVEPLFGVLEIREILGVNGWGYFGGRSTYVEVVQKGLFFQVSFLHFKRSLVEAVPRIWNQTVLICLAKCRLPLEFLT